MYLRSALSQTKATCDQERRDLAHAQKALHDKEEVVAAYETRAQELRVYLRSVLVQLRASHEGMRQEQQDLVDHVVNLESTLGWTLNSSGASCSDTLDATVLHPK